MIFARPKGLKNRLRRQYEEASRPMHGVFGGRAGRKVFDCFLFYNEFDLLELRLKTLDAVVDWFVLGECPITTSGDPKPLYFGENKKRFERYLDKIIHVVTPPPGPGDYESGIEGKKSSESFQRRNLAQGLKRAAPRDIVMLSDVDEIPNPESFGRIQGAINCGVRLIALKQHWHLLFLNARVVEAMKPVFDEPRAWLGTTICTKRNFDEVFAGDFAATWGRKWGESKGQVFKIENGGWHLSYMGGLERVMNKLQATALQTVGPKDAEDLRNRVFVNARFDFVPVDQSFPKDVRENPQKYAAYLADGAAYDEAIRPFVEKWSKAERAATA